MRKTLKSTNPALNYQVIDEVEISSKKEIKEKVEKARKALQSWKEISLEKRVKYFEKLLEVYKKRSKEVAEIQSKEMGKPIKESLQDVEFDLEIIKNDMNLAKKVLKPEVLDEWNNQRNVLHLEPHGVTAVIIPWNYPSSNFFISCNQVLLAGNTVILKHSEECPLTGKLLEEIMEEAGFPEGVFSEVYGDGEVGDMLTSEDIDAIHFTGSSKVGQNLYKKAAEKFIPAVLEMGGSSPGIIFRGADLNLSCNHAFTERYINCGQVCCALKRLIVHEDIIVEVVEKMKKIINSKQVGDPLDKHTDIGPLVAKRQLDLLIEQVKDAKNKGARIVTGGKPINELKGAFYEPTILTNVSMDMRVMKEEVFGPVLPIVSFQTEEKAVEIANNTVYGLSAFIYGKDLEKLKNIASQIKAGQISINGTSYFSENSPFGGYKMSGIGRNSGRYGFYEVTQMKVISEPLEK